jgi:iron complex outermembrane receptor protein
MSIQKRFHALSGFRPAGIVVFLVVFLPCALFASQTSNPTELRITDLSIEQLMNISVSTVTAASKFDQRVTEAPASVTIITASEIKRFGYRTLSDALKGVRGFYTANDRTYSYVGVRGFARPGDYNTRLLLLIDGHKINDGIYNTASIGEEFPIDIDLIEKIEVIRGPGSSLYGSNAFFGVINVITKHAADFDGFEVSGAGGSLETFRQRATYGHKLSNGMEFLVSGTHFSSRGQDLYFREFDSPSTNNGWAEGCDGEKSGSLFGNLVFRDITVQGAYVSRTKDIPTAPYGTIFNDNRTTGTDQRGYLDAKYARDLGNHASILLRFFYDYYHYAGDWIYNYPPITLNRDRSDSRSWGGTVEMNTRFFEGHRVSIGVEYENFYRLKQVNYDVEPPISYLRDSRDSHLWAAYLQDQISLHGILLLNAGIRYDHYKTFGSSFNPRLALILTPTERTSVKLLYGRAFRTPNAYEMYYKDGSLSQKANLSLGPERIETYEMVIEKYISKYRFSMSGFYYRITDPISCTTDIDGLTVFINGGTVEAKGAEFTVERRWSNGIVARGRYSYVEAIDTITGRLLANSPRNLTKVSLYMPLFRGLSTGLELQYTGPRRLKDGGSTGGFVTTNITLLGQELLKNLDVSTSVYNLFDKKYSDLVSGGYEQVTIPQDGINWRIKLTYRF